MQREDRTAPLRAGNEPRGGGRFQRRVKVADAAERERAEMRCAEPKRRGKGAERADHARVGVAAMGKRQQHELEVLRPALRGAPGCGCDDAARLVGDDREKLRKRWARFLVPQVQERLVLQFASEQRADARSRETERMAAAALEFQNEHVAKCAPDRARLDLAALGRRTLAASR